MRAPSQRVVPGLPCLQAYAKTQPKAIYQQEESDGSLRCKLLRGIVNVTSPHAGTK